MHQIKDRDIDLRKRIRSPCGARLLEGIIVGDIFQSIKVVGLRYIVYETHITFEMFFTTYLVFMQH